eukprot:scaffold2634_cov108-Skeletonema_menzelii.AAC.1
MSMAWENKSHVAETPSLQESSKLVGALFAAPAPFAANPKSQFAICDCKSSTFLFVSNKS